MVEVQSNNKTRLEASKQRLATAFNQLEQLLDHLNNNGAQGNLDHEEVIMLKEKLTSISTENKRLADNLQNLSEQYHEMKIVNQEVLEELNGSIMMIESLLIE